MEFSSSPVGPERGTFRICGTEPGSTSILTSTPVITRFVPNGTEYPVGLSGKPGSACPSCTAPSELKMTRPPPSVTSCEADFEVSCVVAGLAAVLVTCTSAAATACAARGTTSVSAPIPRAAAPKCSTAFRNRVMTIYPCLWICSVTGEIAEYINLDDSAEAAAGGGFDLKRRRCAGRHDESC